MNNLSPKAKKLILYLLEQYRFELISFIDYATKYSVEYEDGKNEDEIADASNDLGFVEAIIADLNKE